MKKLFLFAATIAGSLIGSVLAQQPSLSTAMSAEALAAKLDAVGQGSAIVRTQMEIRTSEGGKHTFQLQIKQRRTKAETDLVYLVLWPNDQKGKAVILHQKTGEAPTGSVIEPPNTVRALKESEMSEGLFDSDLTYQDAVENFFAWKKQALVGSEVVDRVNCQILESKPDSSSESIYGKVRSWIDPARLVPLRIEKYSASGELIRRIDTDRVARDDRHNSIPAGLLVHSAHKNTVTQFNGASIKHDVEFTDADFAPAALLH
jgi:outer membrane lipoprotein-sorting protein